MLSINWISTIVLNVLGEVHLQTLATLSKRTIILYSSSGEKTHIHPCVNNKSIVHRFSLLEMKLKDQTITSFCLWWIVSLLEEGRSFLIDVEPKHMEYVRENLVEKLAALHVVKNTTKIVLKFQWNLSTVDAIFLCHTSWKSKE